VIISNGGLVVSTSDFFLSIGRPVVVYQPVVSYQPVYRFPHYSPVYPTRYYHYYPHRPHPGRPPLVMDDRLSSDAMTPLPSANWPTTRQFQDVRTLGPVEIQPASYAPLRDTSPAVADAPWPVATPMVLPASAVTTTPLGNGNVTESVISNPSPFDQSLMDLME
jgi:hypothetical protein